MITKSCDLCGGQMNLEDHAIRHAPECPNHPDAIECPNHPDAIDDTPEPPAVASNVASFALARADKGTKPREHRPEDALDLARAWIAECPTPPDHIIVFMGRTNSDNSSGTKYFQTGTFSAHGQVGLIIEGMEMLRNSGK